MNAINSSRQIQFGALVSYAAIIFNIIAGLVYTPWMIRQIGKSDYGLFILANTFLTYFIMDFGLGNAIARYVSKYRAEQNESKINDLLGMTLKIYLVIDLVLFIVLLVIYFFIQNIFINLADGEIEKYRVVYCIVGLFSLISLPSLSINGILIAYEKFVLLKLCDLLNKITTIILIIVVLLFGFKLYALVLVNSLVGIIIIAIKIIYLSKKTEIKINLRYRNYAVLKELLGFSFWITLIGIAQRLLMNITPTILGIFSGTSQIAIFAIGMTIEAYIWTIANALNGLFLPKVSKIAIEENNKEEINSLMVKVGRIQLVIFGLILGGIISFGKEFIVLWVGKDYTSSFYVVLLLILPGIVTLTQEIGLTLLLVVNELKYRAILFVGASIISVIISVFLAPAFGAVGSAFAIFVALILCHIVGMNIIFHRVVSIDIWRFYRECHLKLIMPIGLALVIGLIIQGTYSSSSMINFLPKPICFAVIYFMILWVFGLNENEKRIIQSIASSIVLRLKIA